MKKLLLSLALLGFAGSAGAQTIGDYARSGATSPFIPEWRAAERPVETKSRPLAENLKLEYYDETLQQIGWQAPVDYGGLVAFTYGQRMTLPTDNGFVDSVRLNFAGAQGEQIGVVLLPDTLFETSPGQFFHLIDIFSDRDAYGEAVIPVTSIGQDGWVTVPFAHVAVPKNFFVAAVPMFNGQQFTSAFVLRGDNKPTRVRTTEDSRSAMVGILTQSSQTLTVLMDSLITIDGQTAPAYTDFFIEAYVSNEPASVGDAEMSSAAIYPNPVLAGNTLRISNEQPISSIKLVNALGAEVSSWSGLNATVEMPMTGIASGVYHLLITTDAGVSMEKIIVQ
jgi:hypothetical protein